MRAAGAALDPTTVVPNKALSLSLSLSLIIIIIVLRAADLGAAEKTLNGSCTWCYVLAQKAFRPKICQKETKLSYPAVKCVPITEIPASTPAAAHPHCIVK